MTELRLWKGYAKKLENILRENLHIEGSIVTSKWIEGTEWVDDDLILKELLSDGNP